MAAGYLWRQKLPADHGISEANIAKLEKEPKIKIKQPVHENY